MLPTSMAKWCELLFPLYSVEFLNLSDDNNSHQSFPWVPLKAARFTEKHNGLLRHSNVQSNTSDTATVPISGAFKWWNSCLMNVRVRKVLVEETRLPSRYTRYRRYHRNHKAQQIFMLIILQSWKTLYQTYAVLNRSPLRTVCQTFLRN